jgi:hypothetical protein
MPSFRRLIAGFPTRRADFDPILGHLGFVVGKVALGQAFSEYLVSPANSHSNKCPILFYYPGLVQ